MKVLIVQGTPKKNSLSGELTVINNEWQELSKLSEKTFVEESDSLKEKGAGAGLLDND